MKYTPGEALKTLYDRIVERMYRGNTQNNTSVNDIDGNSYTLENGYVSGVDLAESEYYSQISYLYKLTGNRFLNEIELLQREQREQREKHAIENDVSALKKRIKYSKNPLEKKRFEKQLNAAYKKRKKENHG